MLDSPCVVQCLCDITRVCFSPTMGPDGANPGVLNHVWWPETKKNPVAVHHRVPHLSPGIGTRGNTELLHRAEIVEFRPRLDQLAVYNMVDRDPRDTGSLVRGRHAKQTPGVGGMRLPACYHHLSFSNLKLNGDTYVGESREVRRCDFFVPCWARWHIGWTSRNVIGCSSRKRSNWCLIVLSE